MSLAVAAVTSAGAIGTGSASASLLPAECVRTWTNHGDNNGFLIRSYDGWRAYADHRLQLSAPVGCDPRWLARGAINLRCEKYVIGADSGWISAICGARGVAITAQRFGTDPAFESDLPYDFGSTGPDGITTVYGGLRVYQNKCQPKYYSVVRVDRIAFGSGPAWTGLGRHGTSHPWPRDC